MPIFTELAPRTKMETEGKSLRIWKDALNTLNPKTQKRYLALVDQFLKISGVDTLEALYQLQIQSTKSEDTRDRNQVERLVKTHFMWLQKNHPDVMEYIGKAKQPTPFKGRKPQSAIVFVMAIISFFNSQNLKLNLNMREFKKEDSIGRESIKATQLKQIYNSIETENRDRNFGIINTLRDSGIRSSDLSNLDISDYKEALKVEDNGNTFLVFGLGISQKKKKKMQIIIGPDAVQSIEAYLQTRPEAVENDPLFINADGNRLSSNSITNICKRICVKVGKNLGAHSFRKYHYSQLVAGGVPEPMVLLLEGKAHSEYLKVEDEIVPAYIAAYHVLQVQNETKLIQAQQLELDHLKEQVYIQGLMLNISLLEQEEKEKGVLDKHKKQHLEQLKKDKMAYFEKQEGYDEIKDEE
jgi:site-specific recombinase XerD